MRNTLVLSTVVVFASLGSQAESFAKNWFVAKSETASDQNAGNSREPFATIAFAIAQAEPGDRVIVRPGDYRDEDTGWGPGTIPVLNSGEAGGKIQIRAAGRDQVVVRRFLLQNCQHIQLTGIQFLGTDLQANSRWRDMPNIVRDVPRENEIDFTAAFETRSDALAAEFATYYSTVEELATAGVPSSDGTMNPDIAIDLENASDVRILRCTMNGYWAGIQCRGADQVRIERNVISHCVNGIFSFLPKPSLSNAVIRSNTISQCLDNGIDVREEAIRVRIQDNTLLYNGRSHIAVQSGSSYCTLKDNFCWGGGYYSETMEFPGSSGVSINGGGDGIVVEQNMVSYQQDLTGIDGNGIILDLMQPGARPLVRSNYVYRCSGAGVNCTISPHSRILLNIFCQNGFNATEPRRGAAIKLSRPEDIEQVIVGNYFLWNRAAGILADNNIRDQKQVDSNFYLSWRSPMIWDGFDEVEGRYFSVRSIYRELGWERRGWGYVFGRWFW